MKSRFQQFTIEFMLDGVKAVISLNERRWPEMWGYVQRAHRILTETASKPTDHGDLRADAMTFFIMSLHLADWIHRDDSNDITEEQIIKAMSGSHIMSLANNLANTSKHFGRDPGKGDDVRIGSVTVLEGSAGRSTSGSIEFERNGKPQTKDVLTLADECLDWWKKYLKQHRLETSEHKEP
ncbi:hypothetical protein [Paenarthrobacter sp. A20]|uniref:hypothetical protein n=1 Tax=Paenarthrobacter sp. A20 TaxID=2817891 RepID=UPI00209ED397|nr:hypothetical protein [Paenarthrobacter sp. A20]MCP1413687.1 hypothetical protein [Paenarthrobacter sp. A20]